MLPRLLVFGRDFCLRSQRHCLSFRVFCLSLILLLVAPFLARLLGKCCRCLLFLCGNFEPAAPYKLFCELRPIENLGKALRTYPLIIHHDPPPPLRACSLVAAMDILDGPTKPHRIRQVVGRRRQPLGCLGLYVCVVIYYCMKTL